MNNNKNNGNTKKGWKFWLSLLFLLACVLPVLLFWGFIFCNSFLSSAEFAERYGMAESGNRISQYAVLSLFPKQVSIEQYKNAFWDNSDFWFYFWNSVRISGLIAIGTIVVSTLGAYALARWEFPCKRWIFLGVIVFMMLPYQVMLAPQMMLLERMDLLNRSSAVILPNIFTTFGTYLLYQFMVQIPSECMEAAQVDGASEGRIFLSIVLPQVRDGISALMILNFIDTWNLVEQPLLYLENQYQYPLSVVLSGGEEWIAQDVFACCVVFFIPILLAFLACKDSLLDGIQNSVVK